MLGIALPVQSQNKKQRTIYLQGTVKDSFTKVMLKAHVTVMDADSAVIDTTTAWQWDRDGGWYLQIPARPGKLIIKGESEGYEMGYLDFNIRNIARNRNFTVPPVLLKKKADDDIYKDVNLDGVVVTGTKIKMTYRGDTINCFKESDFFCWIYATFAPREYTLGKESTPDIPDERFK